MRVAQRALAIMRESLSCSLVVGLAALVSSPLAQPSYVFAYSGTVSHVIASPDPSNHLGLPYVVGQIVTGSFVFNPVPPGNKPIPINTQFNDSVSAFTFGSNASGSVDINSYFLIGDQGGSATVNAFKQVQIGPFEYDNYSFIMQALGPFTSDPVRLTDLMLSDFTLSSIFELERVLIDPSFTSAQVSDIVVQLNSLRIAFVPGPHAPEPATLALLGIGLAGLGFARRRTQ